MSSRKPKTNRSEDVYRILVNGGYIKSPAIEGELGIRGGEVRDCIHYLRKNGFLVCEGPRGYHLTSNLPEIDHTIARLRSRSNSLIEAMNGMVMGRSILLSGQKKKQESLAL